MVPAWLRKACRWVGGHLALSSGLMTMLLTLARLRTAILVGLAAAVVLAGLLHLARNRAHELDDEYRRSPGLRELVGVGRRLTMAWIGAGLLLGVLGVTVQWPGVVAVVGSAVSFAIAVGGLGVGGDTVIEEDALDVAGGSAYMAQRPSVERWRRRAATAPRVPLTKPFRRLWGRKTPRGELSAYLSVVLTTMICVSGAYAGLALAEATSYLVTRAAPPTSGTVSPIARGGSGEGSEEPEVIPRAIAAEGPPAPIDADTSPTYAELCPRMPDPQEVGHGLGDLFERDGAILAGCGRKARRIRRAAYIATGICAGNLRSLAVGSERGAVLLYGDAARFAWRAGDMGALRHAEAIIRHGTEVDIVATVQGSYAFVRSTPALEVSGPATHCNDVVEVEGAFVRLPPPLARLWTDYVREAGWAWPAVDSEDGSFILREPETGEVMARASCESDSYCSIEGPAGRRGLEGIATVSLAELEPFMP